MCLTHMEVRLHYMRGYQLFNIRTLSLEGINYSSYAHCHGTIVCQPMPIKALKSTHHYSFASMQDIFASPLEAMRTESLTVLRA